MVETEAFKDRGHDVARPDGPLCREATHGVAGADHAAACHAAASEAAAEALRPMVTAAGRVDLRCAAKLAERGHERVVEHAAAHEVFQQRRVGLVVHRADDVFHALDRGERLGAVDVPGDLVEHREEGVDRHEPHAVFHQPPCKQAALPEAIHAIPLSYMRGLLGEIKSFAGLGARHQPVGSLKVFVEQPRVFAGLKLVGRLLHDAPHGTPPLEPGHADLVWRQQVRHTEVGLGGIGHQRERVVGLAQEASGLSVGKVAAAAAHQLRQHDKGGQVGAAAEQIRRDAAGVGSVDASRKPPARLQHLPAGIVNGRPGMMAASHEGEAIGDGRMLGQQFGNLEGVGRCADRLERAANLRRCLRLHVPEVEMARPAEVENHDAGAVLMPRENLALSRSPGILRQRKTDRRQSPHV